MLVQLALRLLPLLALGAQDGYVKSFENAWKAVESGDLATARAHYIACLELRPHSATCAYHLACLSAREGKNADAIRWLAAAVDDGYDDANVAKWEPDLAPIHERIEFAPLLARIESNATTQGASAAWYSRAELRWNFGTDFPQFSVDGERLLTSGGDGAILWDVASGAVIAVMPGVRAEISAAAVSPDGVVVATAHDKHCIQLWDAHTGAPLRQLTGAPGWRGSLQFNADGSRLACTDLSPPSSVAVWDVATGKQLAIGIHGEGRVSMSPDGKRVLTSAGLWNVDEQHWMTEFKAVGRAARQAGFSRDGSIAFLLSFDEGALPVLDGHTGAVLRHVGNGKNKIDAVLFAGDLLVTLDTGGQLNWWGADSGDLVRSGECGESHSSMLAASYDGTRLLVPRVSGAQLWDNDHAAPIWGNQPKHGLNRCWNGDISRANDMVALSTWRGVELREITYGVLQRVVHGTLQMTAPAPVSKSARVTSAPSAARTLSRAMLGLSDGRVCEIDVNSGATMSTWKPSSSAIDYCDYTADGTRCIAADETGRVFVWNAHGEPDTQLVGEFASRRPDASFSPDGNLVLVLELQSGASVWSCEQHKVLWKLPPLGSEWPGSAAWSPDSSRIAFTTASNAVMLRDAQSGEQVGPSLAHADYVEALAFSPDGSRLATGCQDTFARVWRLSDGVVEHALDHDYDSSTFGTDVRFVQFSDDGSRLLTTTAKHHYLALWDLASDKRLWRADFGGGNDCTLPAHFSPDCKRICVSGSFCATSSIFDDAGHKLASLEDLCPWGMDFTSDGHAIIAGVDGGLAVLDPDTGAVRSTRAQFDDEAVLVHVPSLHCKGTIAALRATHVVFDRTSAPLDCFAEQLYDPRKVAASLAGIAVADPRLAQPPEIELVPRDRARVLAGESISIAAGATDPLGLASFEVERDGELVDPKLVHAATKIGDDGTHAELALTLPHSADAGEIAFEVRALSKSGVLSRPARVTFRAKP